MEKVIIIGGGASGVVSAIQSKNKNNSVTIIEKNNSLLKKLLITGNGKCNYYNDNQDIKNYHSSNIDIVKEIVNENNLNEVLSFFKMLGIIPKIKNGYYYPFSNQASTIRNALIDEVNNRKIDIINDNVTNIIKVDNGFNVICENNEVFCNKLVIATGSFSYEKTGSNGDGYRFLKELGHNIIKPLPALVPLITSFKYSKDWAGVRTDVVLELFENGKYVSQESGELQLTDYGISGICTFNLTHFITRGLDNNKEEIIKINFVPFIDSLITPWMDKYSKRHKDKCIRKLLEGFLNYKIVDVILKTTNISGDKFYNDLDNNIKLTLCNSLRFFKVKIISTKGFDYSQTCNGGVSLQDINQNTFESKIIPNLYIIGELLDINGKCGGYNLTSCWISGLLSGKDIGGKND